MAAATVLYTINMAGNAGNNAQKLAKDLDKLEGEAKQAKQQLEQVAEKGLGKLGGAFGEAGDAIFDFILPLKEAGSALGATSGMLAAGGIAVGLAAVAGGAYVVGSAMVAMAESAEAARGRLEEMGVAIDPAKAAQLDEYAAATRRLSIAMDQLKVSIGAGIAEEVGQLSSLMAIAIEKSGGYADVSAGIGEAMELTTRMLVPFGGALIDNTRAMNEHIDAIVAANPVVLELADAYTQLGMAIGDAEAEEQHKARIVADATAAVEAQRKATEDASAAAKKYSADLQAAIESGKGMANSISGAGRSSAIPFDPNAKIPMGQQQSATIGREVVAGPAPPEVVSGIDRTTKAVDAVQGGVAGILGMIPIYGDMLGGIWTLLKDVGDISTSIVSEVIGFITGMFDQLSKTITDVPMMIIEAMPDMITAIIALIPKLILELVASGPKLFAALIQAIIELPVTIGREFVAMFEQFWLDIKEALNEMTKIFGDGSNRGVRNDKGVSSYESGNTQAALFGGGAGSTMPSQQQAAQAAANRREGGGSQSRSAGGPSMQPANVTIHNHGVQDTSRFARELRGSLGSYGIGLTLKPFGGG